ncbi:MAG TPA: ABC transporter ATP-binding protein [Thermoanaerobaculia bacterium]|nr:ABC transporter ATP-binding protein [Thermoanaerobaculia bacterium]
MSDTPKPREWMWFARVLRPYARSHVFSIGCLLMATLLTAADPLIIRWIIDHGLPARAWMPIVAAVGAFCALYVIRVGVLSVGTYAMTRTVRYAMLRLRLTLLRRIQSLDARFFHDHGVGDLVNRLEQEIEQLSDAAADILPSLFRVVLGIAVTITVMAALDWRLALIAVPLALLIAALRYRYGPRLEDVAHASRRIMGERASFLSECVGAAMELQLLGAESYVNRRYAKLATASIRTSLKQVMTEIHYAAAAWGIITISTAAVLLIGAYEFMQGRLTVGSYVAFYTYLLRLFDPLTAAITTYVRLKRASGSIVRLTELEQHQPAVRDGEDDAPVPAVQEVALRGVRFGYDAASPVLRGIDVTMKRGEKVALMGESGSGKSTLAKLLVRLYDPHEGTVSIGGHDVRELGMRALRRTTSLVPPSPHLFHGTLRENVLLGYRGVDATELDRLATVACFDTVVARFPERWNHILGANGMGLSEGEKQRLGLLRALVRRRDVLILDEATGALDAATEASVLANLREVTDDRVVLVITHRPSPADWADRVLTLKNGEVRVIHRAPFEAVS